MPLVASVDPGVSLFFRRSIEPTPDEVKGYEISLGWL